MSQCWFRWPDSMPNGPQRACDYPVVGMRDGHPCCAMHAERKVPEEMGNTDESMEAKAVAGWKCKARSANTGANDPQDCDWPFCGCDPYAQKVLDAIEEACPAPAANTEGLRAERAEADIEKLKMDAEHLQYERDEAREKLAAAISMAEERLAKNEEAARTIADLITMRDSWRMALLRVIGTEVIETARLIASNALAEARKESTP